MNEDIKAQLSKMNLNLLIGDVNVRGKKMLDNLARLKEAMEKFNEEAQEKLLQRTSFYIHRRNTHLHCE